jgi:hypothetical protein
VTVFCPAAALKGLVIRGASAQSGALQEWQNSAGAVQTAVAGNGLDFILNTGTGTKWGTVGGVAGQKQARWGATPVVQPLLATGAAHTVDQVITVLQTLGLCRQV